jgi:hypothetical protein
VGVAVLWCTSVLRGWGGREAAIGWIGGCGRGDGGRRWPASLGALRQGADRCRRRALRGQQVAAEGALSFANDAATAAARARCVGGAAWRIVRRTRDGKATCKDHHRCRAPLACRRLHICGPDRLPRPSEGRAWKATRRGHSILGHRFHATASATRRRRLTGGGPGFHITHLGVPAPGAEGLLSHALGDKPSSPSPWFLPSAHVRKASHPGTRSARRQ